MGVERQPLSWQLQLLEGRGLSTSGRDPEHTNGPPVPPCTVHGRAQLATQTHSLSAEREYGVSDGARDGKQASSVRGEDEPEHAPTPQPIMPKRHSRCCRTPLE